MGDKLKIGIAGVGKMGALHLEKYLRMSDVEVAGIHETDRERIRLVEEKFGVRSFAKFSDLLFEVDGIVIAASTAAHYALARQAFEAGVHAFVEKPIAARESEALELVRLARQHKTVLQVGFIERFRYVALAREFPHSPVRFIESHRLTVSPGRETSVDVVSDLMIHDVDLALSLMGAEPSQVSAIGTPVLTSQCDIASVRLEFPHGGVANLSASRVSHRPLRKFRTFSAQAYASMDLIANSIEVFSRDEAGTIRRRAHENPGLDALGEQCRHFVDSIRGRVAPLVSGDDGLRALRMAELIQRKIDERAALIAPAETFPVEPPPLDA